MVDNYSLGIKGCSLAQVDSWLDSRKGMYEVEVDKLSRASDGGGGKRKGLSIIR